MLIRSMSPEIIICDEIGGTEDIGAIQEAICRRGKRNIYSTWLKYRRFKFKSEFEKNYSK